LEDDDKALLLLNVLPKMYEHFKDTFLFRKKCAITFEGNDNLIRTKELQKVSKF